MPCLKTTNHMSRILDRREKRQATDTQYWKLGPGKLTLWIHQNLVWRHRIFINKYDYSMFFCQYDLFCQQKQLVNMNPPSFESFEEYSFNYEKYGVPRCLEALPGGQRPNKNTPQTSACRFFGFASGPSFRRFSLGALTSFFKQSLCWTQELVILRLGFTRATLKLQPTAVASPRPSPSFLWLPDSRTIGFFSPSRWFEGSTAQNTKPYNSPGYLIVTLYLVPVIL